MGFRGFGVRGLGIGRVSGDCGLRALGFWDLSRALSLGFLESYASCAESDIAIVDAPSASSCHVPAEHTTPRW